jgi:hypothetical protein
LLVGSVVIDAEFGREDHSSISRNCEKDAETTLYRTNLQNQIKLVVKVKQNDS